MTNSNKTDTTNCDQTIQSQLKSLHHNAFGWALQCCSYDHEDAEEVLQTAYLKVLRGKAEYRGKSAFKSWFFAVIRNTAKDRYRVNLIRKLRLTSIEILKDSIQDSEPDPRTELHRNDMQSIFLAALIKLPERQKTTLHLVFYQDLSLSEVSEVLGISIGSVRKHYERGKKRLRTILEKKSIHYETATQQTVPTWSR